MSEGWQQHFSRKPLTSVIVTVTVGLGGIGELLEKSTALRGWEEAFVRSGVRYDTRTHTLGVRLWFLLLLFAVAWMVIVLGALQVQAYLREHAARQASAAQAAEIQRLGLVVQDGSRAIQERIAKTQRTLKGMMRAASSIRDRVTPVHPNLTKSICSVRMVYLIHKDFSTEVTREYEIRATTEPIHYWGLSNAPTADAEPVEFLSDLKFAVVQTSGEGEVVYLPTLNELRDKRVTVYFLPRIEPGSPSRRFRLSFRWPGYNRSLKLRGEEDFSTRLSSASTISEVRIEVYFEDESAGVLRGEMTGPIYSSDDITHCEHADLHWKGFIYKTCNIPEGNRRVSFTAKLVKT
jgi:hypothetical protein